MRRNGRRAGARDRSVGQNLRKKKDSFINGGGTPAKIKGSLRVK